MKVLLILLLTIIHFTAFAQVERSMEKNLPKHRVGPVTIEVFDAEEKKLLMLSFNNERYSHISDVGVVWVHNKQEALNLIRSLREISREPRSSELMLQTSEWVAYNKRNRVVLGEVGLYAIVRLRKGQTESLAESISNLKSYLDE